jgi:hypothetical protein
MNRGSSEPQSSRKRKPEASKWASSTANAPTAEEERFGSGEFSLEGSSWFTYRLLKETLGEVWVAWGVTSIWVCGQCTCAVEMLVKRGRERR